MTPQPSSQRHRAADQRRRRLNRRFRAVSRRSGRPDRGWGGSTVLFVVVFGVCFGGLMLSPFPPLQTIRHVAAFPGCTAARAVGLSAAYEGRAGYWPRNDQDGDGVACEPLPGPQRQTPSIPFTSCSMARAADATPVRVGRPGYGVHLDRDRDGVGCEPGRFGQ